MDDIQKNDHYLMGIILEEKTTNKNEQAMADCGGLWEKFNKEEIAQSIPEKRDDTIFAVYYDYEGDHTAPYAYFIGCPVNKVTEPPIGLTKLHIPQQEYKIVTAKGQMPECIAEAWNQIWVSGMKRKYGFDFEVYDERCQNWEDAEVDIYISM
jgi:predicted transcriptional regulator YdeE